MTNQPKKCSRCGTTVLPILGPPPRDRDTWWRNQISVTQREATLRFRMFKLKWLPENPQDQIRETYTTLELCDDCTVAVFAFAQNIPVTRDGLKAREAAS